ncbi:CmcJ/NvfI family oxidoreductase [Rugamonas aquatica]|uniref:Methyltransferase n=1 Tax=Rugamonas aquatica TaxID=2743357 RepID=A0A6A7N8D9_9BURK|nr:CmcJ/NvfI family oxidoreductase [Rugamonas aquatica]MQA41108.1 methyltransferase [Rugamonas aquatica]
MTHNTTAALEYLRPTQERPHTYMYPPPDDQPWENASYHRVPVTIRDARADTALSLDREGYLLRHAPSTVRDFSDKEEVIRRYYPQVAELALALTGASEAFVFDHLLRKRIPGTPQAFGRIEGQRPGAAGRVHCDFTPASARRRLELELRGDTEYVQRYSIINLWRSIRHPVLDAPLAVCDARSATPADLVASDIFYPERNGEIYQAVHNSEHAWSYFPAMTRDEVLVFKQFDSAPGPVARYTPHAAFEHPDAPADAPPRESIEIRCLLIYKGR